MRVHEPLSTLDLIISTGGPHSWPVDAALKAIVEHGNGALVMLNCAEPAQRPVRAGSPSSGCEGRELAERDQRRRDRRSWTCAPTASGRRS